MQIEKIERVILKDYVKIMKEIRNHFKSKVVLEAINVSLSIEVFEKRYQLVSTQIITRMGQVRVKGKSNDNQISNKH